MYHYYTGLSSQPPIKYYPLWKWRWALVLKNLLNPTSRRNASHSCLISFWPKDECTTTTHIIVVQVSKTATSCCGSALLRVIHEPMKGEGGGFPLNPKRRLFVGGLSSRPPIRCCPLWKLHWALVLKDLLNLTLGRDVFHSCLISLWPKDECTTTTYAK